MDRQQNLKKKLHHILRNPDIVEKIFEECTTIDDVSGIPWIYIFIKGRQVHFSSDVQKEALLAAVKEYWKAERPTYLKGNVAMQEQGFKTFFVVTNSQQQAEDDDKKLVERVIRHKGLNQSQLARTLQITPSQINRVLHKKQALHPLVRKVLKDMLPEKRYCIRCERRPVIGTSVHGKCLIGSWIDTSGNFFCEECLKDVKKRPVETCDMCRSAPIVILQDGRKFCQNHIPEQINKSAN